MVLSAAFSRLRSMWLGLAEAGGALVTPLSCCIIAWLAAVWDDINGCSAAALLDACACCSRWLLPLRPSPLRLWLAAPADKETGPRLGSLIEGPKGKQVQNCARRCVQTCIRGGQGARTVVLHSWEGKASRQPALWDPGLKQTQQQLCNTMGMCLHYRPEQQGQQQGVLAVCKESPIAEITGLQAAADAVQVLPGLGPMPWRRN